MSVFDSDEPRPKPVAKSHNTTRHALYQTAMRSHPTITHTTLLNPRTGKMIVTTGSDIFQLRPLEQGDEVRERLATAAVSEACVNATEHDVILVSVACM